MLHEVLLCFLAYVVSRASAQDASLKFIWAFTYPPPQNSFAECEQVLLHVAPLPNGANFVGVPPYFLIAFELGGSPTRANIGSDPNQLSWTVDHEQGTNIMLTIVDSQNNSGGLDTTLFTISAGSTTACVPSSSNDGPSITTNVTNKLNTCDPWSILVAGGKKPYSMYLTALQLAPAVTIVNMGANDDSYTYINRAAPGTLLLASVLDSNNQWGISSQLIRSVGSADVSCSPGGVVPSSEPSSTTPRSLSISGSSASSISASIPISASAFASTTASATNLSPGHGKQTDHTSNKTTDIPLIAGLSAGFGVLSILSLAALLLWWHRHAQRNSMGGIWDPRSNASTVLPSSPPPSPPLALASASIHKVRREGQWVTASQLLRTSASPNSAPSTPSIYTEGSSTRATVGVELSSWQAHLHARPNGRDSISQQYGTRQSSALRDPVSLEDDPRSPLPMQLTH